MPNGKQGSGQSTTQPASKPGPKTVPPIKPDTSTMGTCQKSLDNPTTRETGTKKP